MDLNTWAADHALLVQCRANLTSAQAALGRLRDEPSPDGGDPCSGLAMTDFSLPLRIAAVFIVLAASLVGAAVPIVAKRCAVDGLVFTRILMLGKAVGTGVVIACALVHMLQPSAESLTSACLPRAFNDEYPAFAYFFCMVAVLFMHAFEHALAVRLAAQQAQQAQRGGPAQPLLTGSGAPPFSQRTERIMAALMMEVGVSVHSIFIGLTTGIADEPQLRTLIIALCFHQCFEGIALGWRLAEASFSSRAEAAFALVFAVSAPVGIAIGAAVTAGGVLNTNGVTFLLVQGILDALCAGVLLYLGFGLLLADFHRDLRFASGLASVADATIVPACSHALVASAPVKPAGLPPAHAVVVAAHSAHVSPEETPHSGTAVAIGQPGGSIHAAAAPPAASPRWLPVAMHAALWLGGGAMAYIGRYL